MRKKDRSIPETEVFYASENKDRPDVSEVFMKDPSGGGGLWFVLAGSLSVVGFIVAVIVKVTHG